MDQGWVSFYVLGLARVQCHGNQIGLASKVSRRKSFCSMCLSGPCVSKKLIRPKRPRKTRREQHFSKGKEAFVTEATESRRTQEKKSFQNSCPPRAKMLHYYMGTVRDNKKDGCFLFGSFTSGVGND
jgi:hypothetical protein